MNKIIQNLNQETEAAKTLRAQLADILDDQSMLEAIDSETYLNEAIDFAVQRLIDDQAQQIGLTGIICKLTVRKERIDARIENIRTALNVAMTQAGQQTIEHPAVTLSRKKVPPSVEVFDESAIPVAYWTKQPPKLDKKMLLSDLKSGNEISGAKLSEETQTLQLRWS